MARLCKKICGQCVGTWYCCMESADDYDDSWSIHCPATRKFQSCEEIPEACHYRLEHIVMNKDKFNVVGNKSK